MDGGSSLSNEGSGHAGGERRGLRGWMRRGTAAADGTGDAAPRGRRRRQGRRLGLQARLRTRMTDSDYRLGLRPRITDSDKDSDYRLGLPTRTTASDYGLGLGLGLRARVRRGVTVAAMSRARHWGRSTMAGGRRSSEPASDRFSASTTSGICPPEARAQRPSPAPPPMRRRPSMGGRVGGRVSWRACVRSSERETRRAREPARGPEAMRVSTGGGGALRGDRAGSEPRAAKRCSRDKDSPRPGPPTEPRQPVMRHGRERGRGRGATSRRASRRAARALSRRSCTHRS